MTNIEPSPQGFGYDPIDIGPYFVLTIPRDVADEEGQVRLYQCADIPASHTSHPPLTQLPPKTAHEDEVTSDDAEEADGDRPCIYAQAPMTHWNLVESRLRTYFNARLKKVQLPTGFWRFGENPLAEPLGKELAVLLWGLEAATEAQVLLIYTNWRKLLPEERRWLYTRVVANGLPAKFSSNLSSNLSSDSSSDSSKFSSQHSYHVEEEAGWLRGVQIALLEPLPPVPYRMDSRSAPETGAEREPDAPLPSEREPNYIRKRKASEREGQLRLL